MTMNWIVAKKELGKHHLQLEINAPSISKQWQAGQYVELKITENSIRLTAYIIDANPLKGTIHIFLSRAEIDTHLYAALNPGCEFFEVSGPCGISIETGFYGTVLCTAEASGIVPLFPVIKTLKAAGNRVLVLLSAKTGADVFLEKEIGDFTDELAVMTDDGSKGKQGLLINGMKELIRQQKINKIYAIGSAHVVKYTSLLLQKNNIANCILLFSKKEFNHGAGIIYNITKASSSKSICVDGPDFNAYYPNFDALLQYWGQSEAIAGSQDYQEVENALEYSYLIY